MMEKTDRIIMYNCNMKIVYMQDAMEPGGTKDMKKFTLKGLSGANNGGLMALSCRFFGITERIYILSITRYFNGVLDKNAALCYDETGKSAATAEIRMGGSTPAYDKAGGISL